MAKKKYEDPIDSLEQLHAQGRPFHSARAFVAFDAVNLGQSGSKARRELFQQVMDNFDKLTFPFEDNGLRPKSLYDNLLKGIP